MGEMGNYTNVRWAMLQTYFYIDFPESNFPYFFVG